MDLMYLDATLYMKQEYLEVVRTLCREVNSPYAKVVLRELNRNFIRLDRLDIDVRQYDDPIKLIMDRQIHGMLSKVPCLPVLDDPQQKCLDTFYKFEEQCDETNKRLSSTPFIERDVDVRTIMFGAKRKIDKILGKLPLPEELSFAFGPGQNRNVRRRTSVADKLAAIPECTPNAARQSIRLLSSAPALWTLWGGTERTFPGVNIVAGSHFGQVPKNAKTNRPIDIEPTLNSVLQKGYGTVIRNRLARAGNCIRTGQDRHNTLAREASITKKLATVDKSGASDSISSVLVFELLPTEWFDALDQVRSHGHTINGKFEILNKFSSMGNGFTFELETLIFLCLARATCDYLGLDPSEVSVYGDDVIMPTDAFDLYERVCTFCGFTINYEKSYWGTDRFRESCGADYFDGVDVRVAYLRHEPSPHYLTVLHNRLINLGIAYTIPNTMAALTRLIPKRFRIFGPVSDHLYGYLHSDKFEHQRNTRVITIKPTKYRVWQNIRYVYALYSVSVRDNTDFGQFTDKIPVTLERFQRRGDFTLKYRRVTHDGLLIESNRCYNDV